MIGLEFLKYSLQNLRKRKLRSWLTVVSVLIGIAAITSLVSFGNGITAYVEDISQKMGGDKFILQPRGMGFGAVLNSNVRLDEDDLDVVRDADGVAEATGVYILSVEVQFNDEKKYTDLHGLDYEEYEKLIGEVYNLNIEKGSLLDGNEMSKILLGANFGIEDKVFDKPVKIRDKIIVNSVSFKVAGIYEAIGDPHEDMHTYMNADAVEEFFNASNYQFIVGRVDEGKDPARVTESIRKELREHRNQKKGNEDFFVETFEQVIATFSAVLTVITVVVMLIALISLIVAAVNIMNTMYASILERTNEIGVLKALGSRNRSILLIFVFESGFLSFIGGVLGVVIGYLLSSVAGDQISKAGYAVFNPLFTWQLALYSILFATFIGLIAGALPAYKASKLSPIEALRYE